MKHNKLFPLIASAVCMLSTMLTGCIKEDISECDLYLRFSYTYNMSGEELFPAQVEAVHLFVFDAAGNFVMQLTETDASKLKTSTYMMPAPHYTRGCQAVVWAGRLSDSYSLPTMNAGDPMRKLQLELTASTTSSSNLASLWHAGPVALNYREPGRQQTIHLVRTTNNLSVGLMGSNANSADNEVCIVSDNGKYAPDHSVVSAGDVTYKPYSVLNNTSNLTTMRFVKGVPANLSIINKTTNQPITFGGESSIDLVTYFLKDKPAGMSDQEYLDRQYEWTINLNLDNYIALSITINGWTTWFDNTDL